MIWLYIKNMAMYALIGSILYYAFYMIKISMAEDTAITLDGNCLTKDEYDSAFKSSVRVWCFLLAIYVLIAIIGGFFIVPKMEMGEKLSWLIFK